MSWLPRIGILPNSSPGLCDWDDPRTEDFDGRTLVIQWGRFVFELFLGKRS